MNNVDVKYIVSQNGILCFNFVIYTPNTLECGVEETGQPDNLDPTASIFCNVVIETGEFGFGGVTVLFALFSVF